MGARRKVYRGRVVVDSGYGWFYVEGKGHSWGSFKSREAAHKFIDEVIAEDVRYAARVAGGNLESE